MSFITDLITSIEQSVLSALESLIAKAERGGQVTADELKSVLNTAKTRISEARNKAE